MKESTTAEAASPAIHGAKAAGPGGSYTIRRRPLYEQAIEAIAEYILSSACAAGSSLPTEGEFAAMLGVGRNTVREALKTLQAMGIIEAVPKRGMVLRGLDLGRLKAFMPFMLLDPEREWREKAAARYWYETSIAPFIIENATEEVLEQLERILDEPAGSGRDGLLEKDMRFHLHLVEKCVSNPIIRGIGSIVHEYFMQARPPLWELTEAETQRISAEHREIVRLVRARDEAGLKELLQRHLLGRIAPEEMAGKGEVE